MTTQITQVSVVVCTKDRPANLERCLRAVLHNDLQAGEVIVIDQGTSPGITSNIRQEFQRRNLSLRHIPMGTLGVSRGRNLGAQLSGHELIAFTDDDCIPTSEWLRASIERMAMGADAVSGPIKASAAESNRRIPLSLHSRPGPTVFRGTSPHAPWSVGRGGNLMVTKSIFREVRGFNESLGPGTSGRAAEDVDLFYRMLRAGATIAYEPKAIVYHERVSLRSWLRSRYPYGYGMGAFLAAHAQSDDTRAYGLFRQYIWMQVRSGLSSIRHASVREFAGSMLTISGVLCGFSRRWYQVCVAY